MSGFVRVPLWTVSAVAAMVLAACGSTHVNRAPVEDRGSASTRSGSTAADPRTATAPAKQLPGYENAGKPGYYMVKPGDTLIRIGLEAGQSHKDISRWNALENPNKIEVGQVLRVIPPVAGEPVATPVVAAAASTSALPPTTAGSSKPSTATPPASAASAPVAASPATTAAAAPAGEDEIAWIWPSNGPTINGFDESKNKGVDLGGNLGDPVVAAADGKVVYAGSGLRGYGNLIILKHNNVYLTAYAHNKTLLVKEDQSVKKGQKIAEMGDTDADRVKLHFELRRQGKPVDPTKYFPTR
jgi:lipoprotein NlpD